MYMYKYNVRCRNNNITSIYWQPIFDHGNKNFNYISLLDQLYLIKTFSAVLKASV